MRRGPAHSSQLRAHVACVAMCIDPSTYVLQINCQCVAEELRGVDKHSIYKNLVRIKSPKHTPTLQQHQFTHCCSSQTIASAQPLHSGCENGCNTGSLLFCDTARTCVHGRSSIRPLVATVLQCYLAARSLPEHAEVHGPVLHAFTAKGTDTSELKHLLRMC